MVHDPRYPSEVSIINSEFNAGRSRDLFDSQKISHVKYIKFFKKTPRWRGVQYLQLVIEWKENKTLAVRE